MSRDLIRCQHYVARHGAECDSDPGSHEPEPDTSDYSSDDDECEIDGCGRPATATQSGVSVCDRCRTEFVSVGCGAVYFAGRWHGVTGARYTAEQVAAYPGLAVQP